MPSQFCNPLRSDWYQDSQQLLQEICAFPVRLFLVSEVMWLTNEIYGRVRFTNEDQGLAYVTELKSLRDELSIRAVAEQNKP